MTSSLSRPRFRGGRTAQLLTAVSLIAILACGDDPTAPELFDFGSFKGKWNGKSWQGSGYAVIRNDSLFLQGHRPDPTYYHDEYVNVATPFAGVGIYAIDASGGRLSSIVGGDAGHFPAASGTLHIISYDSESRALTGTLELRSATESLPWTFLDGEFAVLAYDSFAAVPLPPCRRPARCSD